MFEELIDPRMLGKFREDFANYFRSDFKGQGVSHERFSAYFQSQGFQTLNSEARGLGPAYLGLIIHRLLESKKIRLENNRYVNGSGKGIDSSLDEGLTIQQQRQLVRILEPGIQVFPEDTFVAAFVPEPVFWI